MSSRKEEERNEKIIRGLMKLPPNRRCINCNSLGPQYVCTNFWTFVCMTCSGIHREFTHRVKSVSMSKFTTQEVEALQEGGNQRARETFLRDWDPREQRLPDNSNVDKVRDFIKSVYVDKKFFASKTSGKPPRDTLNHRNLEDETRRASSYHSYSQSPPYDYQYEERRYGKQPPALTKKPGSDRGMLRFLSTSRLSDHVQEDGFANESVNSRVSDYSVTNGNDLMKSGSQSPLSLSHSSGSGKYDGLDLFTPSNPPQQSATSAPEKFATSAPEKFSGLDLFNAPDQPQPATSAPETFAGLDLFNAPGPTQPATSAPFVEPKKFGGLDLFNAPYQPQVATSEPSAESGKFGGLDLFSAPNQPQPATSAPATEPEKFVNLDLFDLLATSSSSVTPTLSVDQEFKSFGPDFDLFTVIPPKQPTENLNQKNDGWATFDLPWHAQSNQQHVSVTGPSSLTHWDVGVNEFAAPIIANNNNINQSWSSVEAPVQDHLVADPYLAWGISENFKMKDADYDTRSAPFASITPRAIGSLDSSTELTVLDGARSHKLDTKSNNPFDFPSDTEIESSNMFLDMSSMQSALPNHNMSTPWFPDSATIPFTSGKSQDALVFLAGQASSMQIPNIQAPGPVASVGGNPFG